MSVAWDQPPGRRKYTWCLYWQDGPTVEQVKAWAQDLATLDVEALYFARSLSTRAWAIHLVRHVVAGGTFENRYGARYDVLDGMMAMPSPDAAADDREAARAEALVRLAGPHDEARMIDVLAAHGLAALDGEGELPPGVTPLRRPSAANGGAQRPSAPR